MHKKIAALTLPNIISNITVPLLGMVDIAMAGRLGDGDRTIAAISMGATIFNFIYWNCAFLRMGTSGLVAQAWGARNLKECTALLLRGMVVAVGLALLLLLFRGYVGEFALGLMFGSDTVESMAARYFAVRIWAAPATISLYALQGWFIGMQNARTPMWCSIVMNLINIGVGLLLVFGYQLHIEGIAWATVAAQYGGVLFSLAVWFRYYRRLARYIAWKELFLWQPLLAFFKVNRDIFLRTACIVTVFTFFTSASSAMGDTTLAINALLMQLFTLYSFMSDGIAYAAESLVGRYVGAGNSSALREAIRKLSLWALGFALLCSGLFAVAWRPLFALFNPSAEVMQGASPYVVWSILVPLVGFAAFLLDGVLIGATRTRTMRNTMFVALVVFFATYFSLQGVWGNSALWLAFLLFLATRGIAIFVATNRLQEIIYLKE